jgi:tetratricopeptide (TPR) repeat protein
MLLATVAFTGCGPSFRELRVAGQEQMIQRNYGTARNLFLQAMDKIPEDAVNLHDLGDCSLYLARDRFLRREVAAAKRYVDQAVEFYTRAVNAHPGLDAAHWGKNTALELKEQFGQALRVAEWAAEFVGPTARQQIFLARELEERNDPDAALLRYRQAVAMEPRNAYAHAEMGRFLKRQNKEEAAIEHLLTAYRLNPLEPGVRRLLQEMRVTPPPMEP